MSNSENSHLNLLRKISLWAHMLPGGFRLAEVLRKRYSNEQQDVVLNNFDSDLKMCVSLSDHIGGQIFWHGFYSVDQLNLANRLLKETDIVFDVGANIGEFSVFAAKRVSKGFVHAFEPTQKLFQIAKKNLEINSFQNSRVYHFGFSNKNAQIPIYTAVERGADGAINHGMNSLFKDENFKLAETIKVTTLDEWSAENQIQKLDYVKMDIEGSELFALQGGEKTLKKLKPKLVIEINPKTCERAGYKSDDLARYILDLGYTIYNIERGGHTRKLQDLKRISRDVLCVFE